MKIILTLIICAVSFGCCCCEFQLPDISIVAPTQNLLARMKWRQMIASGEIDRYDLRYYGWAQVYDNSAHDKLRDPKMQELYGIHLP